MKGILRFLLSGLAVLLASYLLPGVDVKHFGYALLVSIVLTVINSTVRPVLVVLTIPATLLTLGLFLLIINALMIQLVDWLVPGFEVDGFWWALAFSLIVSLFNSIFEDSLAKTEAKTNAFRADKGSGIEFRSRLSGANRQKS